MNSWRQSASTPRLDRFPELKLEKIVLQELICSDIKTGGAVAQAVRRRLLIAGP